MSKDDFVYVKEMEPDKYSVFYGMGDDEGNEVFWDSDLKTAIKMARAKRAEYGIGFSFLDDTIAELEALEEYGYN